MPWELIRNYLEDRQTAARAISAHPSIGTAFLGFALGSLSLAAAAGVSLNGSLGLPALWSLAAGLIAARLTLGFFSAAALHLLLELSGEKGSAAALFVHFGLAELSWTLALPLSLLARAACPAAWPALLAALWLLCLRLRAHGIKDAYGIGAAKAWLFCLLPYLTLILLLPILALAALAGALSRIFSSLPIPA